MESHREDQEHLEWLLRIVERICRKHQEKIDDLRASLKLARKASATVAL